MAINIDARYRVRRNAEQEEQMRYIVQELKLFGSYAQVVIASAIVGYNFDAYVPFDKYASDGILMQFFAERDKDIINMIAYAKSKNQDILRKDPLEMYRIFEAYANGGFPILMNKLGVDFVDKTKNDRLTLLRKYYSCLLSNSLKGRK